MAVVLFHERNNRPQTSTPEPAEHLLPAVWRKASQAVATSYFFDNWQPAMMASSVIVGGVKWSIILARD
jgi:hypothetical protein